MKQPLPKSVKVIKNKKAKYNKNIVKVKKQHKQQYGTSKLEKDFAKLFLDANNIQYIYQYEAKEIGRFFDFAVTSHNKPYIMEEKDGIECVKQDNQAFEVSFLLEIDGDYFHANPIKYKDKKLTPTQKHNLFVDKLKDQYAGMHCIPLVRFWENDIRNNPEKVLETLKHYITITEKKRVIMESKKRPH